ncbi:hypothetical protein BC332_34139 [Capsicum chinense]|nr:hypothetical protein BC332_34139 [Capsicum chinense]
MVTVSQQQPEFKKIQGEIAGGVGLTLKEGDLLQRGDWLRARLMQKGSRVLVILDDVWEVVNLKRLGIPGGSDRNYQCKVAFTTCLRGVCDAMEAQKIVDVEILSDEEGWILFRQKVGNSTDDPSLSEVAKDVAKECKRLPLAIVTVAGALKGKTKPSWEDALVELKKSAPKNIPGVLENVYQPLKISYNHLESDESRYIFLLCSLFEEDSNIWTEELLRYGMGLGIFSELENLERGRSRVLTLLRALSSLCYGKCISGVYKSSNNAITDSNPLFNEKVSCPNLEVLQLYKANSITALCSHQLPTAYFRKLEKLEVRDCGKLRNLMSPSVARGLLNLRTLLIQECQSMEEVITEEEQQVKEIVTNEPLFPRLEVLKLYSFPKLGHFILTRHALEFSFLREVDINEGPKMKTFMQQETVSTLHAKVCLNDDELKVVDLNEPMFNSKVSCPNLKELELNGANCITALCFHQLSMGYFSKLEKLEVRRCGELRNLMSPSVARGLLNLRKLWIKSCQSMEEVITEEEQEGDEIMWNEPLFPRLEDLYLNDLPKLGHFILTKQALEFPFLKEVDINECPKLKTFIQQETVSTLNLESVNNDDELKVVDLNKAMFNCKVTCPNLKYLVLYEANSITALCSHQLPTAYFSKLERLEVRDCGKLRNLMSPSVARGLLNLRTLCIQECQSMEEVITEEEQQGKEIMCSEPLSPRLEDLYLNDLPKLGHFIWTKQALAFPFLREVDISKCPKLKTFIHQGTVSTLNLESVNNDDELKVVDLNKAMFNSKVCLVPLYNYILYIFVSFINSPLVYHYLSGLTSR